ncbi:tryptophan synthase subunit alpha, partial [Escherichia coli]|nr:tryptophan synthase subunit alpha [Escherichia coli]
ARGTRTADVLAIVKSFRLRHPDVPLVLMGYANTMTRPTPTAFAEAAARAGADGVIIVDIPPEEAGEVAPFVANGIDVIRLATPTTDAARLPAV